MDPEAWILGPWRLARSAFLKIVEHVGWKFTFLSVSWSPSPVRLCRSCLRRFGDLKKNTPLDVWSVYLVDFGTV